MKKLFTAAAVLVALLIIAPFGFGKLAQRHVDHDLDRLMEEMPYLTIVERSYTSGWFRSEQEVTFEVLGDWTPEINKIIEAANARDASDTGEAAAQAEVESSDEAVAANASPMPEFKPPRFTVRNEILHGPVLWPGGFGAAHVNTHIVWGAKMRHDLVEAFGDDQPFRVSTRIGFLGGGTTTFSGDARTLKPAEGEQLSWDKFEFNVNYSGNGDHMRVTGGWPRLEFRSADGVQFAMRGLKANGTADRIVGELYDSDGQFELESFRMVASDGKAVEASDIKYIVNTENRGDFVDLTFKLGTGPIKVADFSLQEAHYDFALRRLHSASVEKLLVAMKESYASGKDGLSDVDDRLVETYRKHAITLLEHDPEFVIERVNLVTKTGDGTIKGSIRFKGVTAADLEMGGLPLIGKIEAEFDIDVAESLLAELGGEPGMVATAEEGGYVVRRDGRVVSKIEFRHGDLKINGKSQGIPGVGRGAKEMPPQ